MIELPTPKPWRHRASTAPWVPGNTTENLPHLRALLEEVDRKPYLDRPFTWPLTGSETTVRQAVRSLGTSGLIEKTGETATLTPEARKFLETGDSAYLLGVIHANVRFIGEALCALDSPMTHEQLNEVASTDYQMAWTSMDQVRRRTTLARAADLVELWRSGNKLVLTDKGREFCSAIEIADPTDLPGAPSSTAETSPLATPGPMIAALITRLDEQALAARKNAVGDVPGNGLHDNLRHLVDLSSPSITFDDFHESCMEHFDIARSSAKQTLVNMRALGLLEQTALDTIGPSPASREWMASDAPTDLVRILHSKVGLVAEVLLALSPTEKVNTTSIHTWLTSRYGAAALTRSELTTRLVLLRESGLVERVTHLTYRLTSHGLAFRESIPMQQPKPEDTITDESPTPSATETLATMLITASRTIDQDRFEALTAEAFGRLGADVQYLPGREDHAFVASFWTSPTHTARMLVVTRPTPSGKIVGDLILHELEENRRRHKANQAAIVAPGFAAGLATWAAEKNILPITADHLARLVTRFTETPVPGERLVTLLNASDPEPAWQAEERSFTILARVAETLWNCANDPKDVKYTSGRLSSDAIWRDTRRNERTPLDLDEVDEALDLLTHPKIRGAVKHAGDKFSATGHPAHIATRLRALAERLERISPRSEPLTPPARPQVLPRPRKPSSFGVDQIRTWAQKHGYKVGKVGKLPKSVVDAFHAHHSTER